MFERIWACGDLHGSHLPIENFWRRHKDTINFSKETDCIILLGDVGANYYLNGRDNYFKKKMEKLPFTFFCIRGNHEARVSDVVYMNPESWHLTKMFGNLVYYEDKYPSINYALDTINVYNISIKDNTYKTLIIPGAYSVDKDYRLAKGWSWFENEQLSSEEMKDGRRIIKENRYNFDLILSHTCPINYEPTDLFLSFVNQSTVDKTMERFLGEIDYQVNYKLWLWGHYHDYRIYPRYENSQCIMLSAGKEVINVEEWLYDTSRYHSAY